MSRMKFRVWDKCVKKFAKQIVTFKFDRIGNINLVVYLDKTNKTREIHENERVYTNKFDIIQYTGLLDKSGVGIYEGDIIELPYITTKEIDCYGNMYLDTQILPSEYYVLAKIDRSKSGAYFIRLLNENDYKKLSNCNTFRNVLSYYSNHVKVIGNIYENKELLKDKR